MLSRNQIKHIQSLKQKKFREIHRQFLAEGAKLVSEIVESGYIVMGVYSLSGWLKDNESILVSKNIPFFEISEGEMERITALSSPSPVLAIAGIPSDPVVPFTAPDDLLLALDDIRDPGNLGTIIRIADWFGIHTVLCSDTSVDLYNPKVIQASMGSVTRVRVRYCDLPGFLSSVDPSVKIYGTFPEGENIYSMTLDPKGIVLIGSESNGISPEVVSLVTDKIGIPSYSQAIGKNRAESLNASIATAIVCSEFRRRK
ncbi:MAG: RNA methyltransferase [Bacteroidetes bacterium]|nr:RNA methyltransferase [Bacteroidota bacterium]